MAKLKILVTGAAGFIGFHVCQRLALGEEFEVLGVDNLNNDAAIDLKQARLDRLSKLNAFRFARLDFAEVQETAALFDSYGADYVLHLGAQTGVRYSLQQPAAYLRNNIVGFFNVLEGCRRTRPRQFVFASSSSVYGASARVPFVEDAHTDRPISFYGATKMSNEVMAHSYAHLHGLVATGMRFFTVYGPWGRPDMAPSIFAKAICERTPIQLYNDGRNLRDFTYVDDVVDGVLRVLLHIPAATTAPPFRIFNLGHHRPVEIRRFVQLLETLLGRPAMLELRPPSVTDLPETCANIDRIHHELGFSPRVALEDGLRNFVEWFKDYYHYN